MASSALLRIGPRARTSPDTSPVLTALATFSGCARSSQIVIAATPAVSRLATLARLNTTLCVRFMLPAFVPVDNTEPTGARAGLSVNGAEIPVNGGREAAYA